MLQQLILNGVIAGSIYALIAIGFAVIYSTVRFFHFAHGAVYAAGAYVAYSLSISLGLPLVVSFFLSAIFSAGLGVVIDRGTYWPLRQKGAPNLVFLVVSFGVFIFIQNTIQLIYGTQILSLRTGPVKEGYQLSVFGVRLGAVITENQILILVVSCLLTVALFLAIKFTKLGKALRAVADDPVAARLVGIHPDRIILYAFAIGSALAGMAGVLVSLDADLEPTMGLSAILKGIIASTIGGIGSIPGAVAGAFFLGLAENLGIWKIQAGWKDCIAFGILIIFLLVRPEGFFGAKIGRERV